MRIDKGSYNTTYTSKGKNTVKRFWFHHYAMLNNDGVEYKNFLAIKCNDFRTWYLHTDNSVRLLGKGTAQVPQQLLEEAKQLLESLQ
jgi:hypothetical protein